MKAAGEFISGVTPDPLTDPERGTGFKAQAGKIHDLIFWADQQNGSFDVCGARHDDTARPIGHRSAHDRCERLNDPGFLDGDLLQGVTEHIYVIVIRVRNDRDFRRDHIGRVLPAANTDFDDGIVHLGQTKGKERRSGEKLERAEFNPSQFMKGLT